MPERSDLSLRGLLVGAAIIAGGIAISIGAAALVTSVVDARATGPSAGEPPKIEGPVLQTDARQDLGAYLREKNERLESSGPVDAGHVHIPIERAMQVMARSAER